MAASRDKHGTAGTERDASQAVEENTQDVLFSTIEAPAQSEVVIKKSRFIGQVVPIRSAADAEAQLAAVRERHQAANHNCYAWRVGLGVPVERFSDDGEPGGTAGRPILEVLRRLSILNALVVVTRYFGGTLLGASGLIRAYADATAEAVAAATVLECVQMCQVHVACDYSAYGKLEYELTTQGYALVDNSYQTQVTFAVWVRQVRAASLLENLANWSGGQAQTTLSDASVVGVRPDGRFVFGVWPDPDPSTV